MEHWWAHRLPSIPCITYGAFLHKRCFVTHTITLEGLVNEATFVLKWNKDDLGSDVTLRQPDGTLVGAPTTVDSLHYLWRIPAQTLLRYPYHYS